MNITEAQNFLTVTAAKLTDIQGRQIQDGEFSLPTDDARRILTGLTGTAFDLRQMQLKLEAERKALLDQLREIETLGANCSNQCVLASTLTTALMANQAPA